MSVVTKCYCDKCGKVIDGDYSYNKVSSKVFSVEYSYYDEDCYNYLGINKSDTLDLCKECSIELHRFLNNVPEWA